MNGNAAGRAKAVGERLDRELGDLRGRDGSKAEGDGGEDDPEEGSDAWRGMAGGPAELR